MRLVTQTDILGKAFGDEQAIQILAKNGFDALDWSFFEMLKDDNEPHSGKNNGSKEYQSITYYHRKEYQSNAKSNILLRPVRKRD